MTNPSRIRVPRDTPHATFGYDTFVADPIPINVAGLLPNRESHMFSPLPSTLIYGQHDAILVDAPLTTDQAKALGHWIEASGKRLTRICATHGHSDHWFTANVLAERSGAQVIASAGTIQQMHNNVSVRDVFWDKLWPVSVPDLPGPAHRGHRAGQPLHPRRI
jgi:glyoxylase-like metal-dependent hydrolase (beta-lactamase superfamily II)